MTRTSCRALPRRGRPRPVRGPCVRGPSEPSPRSALPDRSAPHGRPGPASGTPWPTNQVGVGQVGAVRRAGIERLEHGGVLDQPCHRLPVAGEPSSSPRAHTVGYGHGRDVERGPRRCGWHRSWPTAPPRRPAAPPLSPVGEAVRCPRRLTILAAEEASAARPAVLAGSEAGSGAPVGAAGSGPATGSEPRHRWFVDADAAGMDPCPPRDVSAAAEGHSTAVAVADHHPARAPVDDREEVVDVARRGWWLRRERPFFDRGSPRRS